MKDLSEEVLTDLDQSQKGNCAQLPSVCRCEVGGWACAKPIAGPAVNCARPVGWMLKNVRRREVGGVSVRGHRCAELGRMLVFITVIQNLEDLRVMQTRGTAPCPHRGTFPPLVGWVLCRAFSKVDLTAQTRARTHTYTHDADRRQLASDARSSDWLAALGVTASPSCFDFAAGLIVRSPEQVRPRKHSEPYACHTRFYTHAHTYPRSGST